MSPTETSLAVEGAEDERVTGLARSHLLEGFVRPQHRLAQRPGALERHGLNDEIAHSRRLAVAGWISR